MAGSTSSSSVRTGSALPGDVIGTTHEYICGIGCYVWKDKNSIRSALCGKIVVTNSEGENKPKINISAGDRGVEELISVQDKVLCQVLKLNVNQAIVSINYVGDSKLNFPPRGIIRREDVADGSDTVAMYQYFRPGDIVKAEVVSLGDSRFYLTTDGDDLGVVGALSQGGNRMVVSGPQVSVFHVRHATAYCYFFRKCRTLSQEQRNGGKFPKHYLGNDFP
jgi:exosome complex component CSL4